MRSSVVVLYALAVAGCSPAPMGSAGDAGPALQRAPVIVLVPTDGGEPQLDPPVQAVRLLELRGALGLADADVVGVAIDPSSGERLVVEAKRGLYRLEANGGARRVWDPSSDSSVAAGVVLPLTDVVAIGHGLFAVSARNQGYFIDPTNGAIVGHFCYVPDGFSVEGGRLPPAGNQLTEALALQPASGGNAERIIAQPQTFNDYGDVIASHFAFFDVRGGESLLWLEINTHSFNAHAMVAIDGKLLMSGERAMVSVMSLADPTYVSFGPEWWAYSMGLHRIEGFAFDARAGTLLVVDGEHQRLLDVAMTDIFPSVEQ